MNFEEAIEAGELDRARVILSAYAELPDTGGFGVSEGYYELATALDRAGRRDEAIEAMELAIEHGWRSAPDPRSDIAEFHLRAGRGEQAASIWTALKQQTPDDVWLYNAAGLSYGEVGEHESAVAWLGEGIEVAMSAGDPEGLVGQLSDLRRRSLDALGREHDELERRVGLFMEEWHGRPRPQRPWDFPDATEADPHAREELAVPRATAAGSRWPRRGFPLMTGECILDRRCFSRPIDVVDPGDHSSLDC